MPAAGRPRAPHLRRAAPTLFTFGNAAMLPLVGSALTKSAGDRASLLIAACIVLPQLIVALISPRSAGSPRRAAGAWCCCSGFATLPIRGLLFALTRPSGLARPDPGARRHRRGLPRRPGAADHQRHRRPVRPLQSVARLRRLRHRHRRDAQHRRSPAGSPTARAIPSPSRRSPSRASQRSSSSGRRCRRRGRGRPTAPAEATASDCGGFNLVNRI